MHRYMRYIQIFIHISHTCVYLYIIRHVFRRVFIRHKYMSYNGQICIHMCVIYVQIYVMWCKDMLVMYVYSYSLFSSHQVPFCYVSLYNYMYYVCRLFSCHQVLFYYVSLYHIMYVDSYMGWLRLVGSLKLYVSFAEYSLFYRALLQKRPINLRSLLILATP